MELSPSDKGRIEHQFDSFCKLVLVCEMKDYKKMILRKMAKEILFSELILIYGYDLEHKKVGQEEIKDKNWYNNADCRPYFDYHFKFSVKVVRQGSNIIKGNQQIKDKIYWKEFVYPFVGGSQYIIFSFCI